MAKTYQDLLTEAREILQDTESDTYRNTDEVLIAKLNQALQEINRLRPDAYIDTFDELVDTDTEVPEVTTGNLSDTFPIPMLFFTAVINFIAGSCDLKEDEFATDGRAAALLAAFRNMVIGI